MLKSIFTAKINLLHLLLVNLLAIFLTWFIIRDIAPFAFWAIVGDGGSPPHSWDIWLNAGVCLSAVIPLYPIALWRIRANYKKGRPAIAKSFLIALGVIALASVFVLKTLL